MNGHGPPRTASTALGSPQASYVGRRSDSRIGRQSPLPPKPFNRQPSISTRRTRHPPEYSCPPDTTRCTPPIARSGTPRRTPPNLNISAIPRNRRDIRIPVSISRRQSPIPRVCQIPCPTSQTSDSQESLEFREFLNPLISPDLPPNLNISSNQAFIMSY